MALISLNEQKQKTTSKASKVSKKAEAPKFIKASFDNIKHLEDVKVYKVSKGNFVPVAYATGFLVLRTIVENKEDFQHQVFILKDKNVVYGGYYTKDVSLAAFDEEHCGAPIFAFEKSK